MPASPFLLRLPRERKLALERGLAVVRSRRKGLRSRARLCTRAFFCQTGFSNVSAARWAASKDVKESSFRRLNHFQDNPGTRKQLVPHVDEPLILMPVIMDFFDVSDNFRNVCHIDRLLNNGIYTALGYLFCFGFQSTPARKKYKRCFWDVPFLAN
jgi:hypothetical protein